MFNISSFLAKITKNIKDTELDSEEVLFVIFNKTQIQLKKEDIEIKNNIIYTKTSPAVKNKLFIFKESILEEINKNISQKIIDIR